MTFAGQNYTLYPVSYTYNSNLMGVQDFNLHLGTLGILGHVPQLTAPASTVMLCETTSFHYPDSSGDNLSYADLSMPDEVGDQGLTGVGGGYCSVGSAGSSAGGIVGGVYFCSIPLATGYTGGGPTPDSYRHLWQQPCNNSTADCPRGLMAATGRHSDGSNYLLCDGHARWLRGDVIGTGQTYPKFAQPTDTDNQSYVTPSGTFGGSAIAPGTSSTQGATPSNAPFAVTYSPI